MKTRHSNARSHGLSLLALAFTLTLGACSSVPPQLGERLAIAEAAVQRANTASTAETAARELQLATDKLAAARAALTARDYTRSEQLADQAQLDARVAELHAQSERSRQAAQESQDAARALREEISRQNK